MIETQSKKVAPHQEQEVINLMANFGWSLQSSQEINSTDSHLERRGDDIYSVTTKENYVKLVFQRDTAMPNYARVKELEQKYMSLVANEPDAPTFDIKIAAVAFFFFFVPCFIYVYLYRKKKKAYDEAFAAWCKAMEKDGKAMLEEAASLLS